MAETRAEDTPFRFRAGESPEDAVRRIARCEIEAITAALGGRVDDETVHEVRKATKRLRALLRIFRSQLGERDYRRENRTFRDAARALSPTRDAQVILATLDHLATRFTDGRHARLFRPFRRAARVHLAAVQQHENGVPRAKRRVVTAARIALRRVARWSVPDDGWAALGEGLSRIYARGHCEWRAAARKPRVARLHEWRKRVKDLRYALELLEPVWPDVMRAYADEVDQLADRLGEDHDLAVLHRFVRDRCPDAPERDAMLALIDASRLELQARVWTVAARIYESAPRRFVRRLERYWDAWCVEATAATRADADASAADVARHAVSGWA